MQAIKIFHLHFTLSRDAPASMFPPRAGQCAYVIDGAHTEMCVTEYSNRVFVVVTQVGKLGTVFHITTDGDETALQDAAMMLRVDPNAMNDKVRVRTLIGKRDDALLIACARHVGEVLASRGCEKCVLFGFDSLTFVHTRAILTMTGLFFLCVGKSYSRSV